MTTGVHLIIYSKNAEADKAFFHDVLNLTHVDVGHGWLIFGLPPSELAVHPAETNNTHELYLMCENIEKLIMDMRVKGIECSPVESLRWGQKTSVRLPGGGLLGVYQPRHARPGAA